MNRQAQREHFERVCQLRDRYGRLGRADRTSVISITDVIALANRLMLASGDPKPTLT